eukprot:jgi/Psemu1/52736/gm1.52736_g
MLLHMHMYNGAASATATATATTILGALIWCAFSFSFSMRSAHALLAPLDSRGGARCVCALHYSNAIPGSASRTPSALRALSEYYENDVVSVRLDRDGWSPSQSPSQSQLEATDGSPPRLCVVTQYGGIAPLCTHEDDNPTDLHVDPRVKSNSNVNGGDEIDSENIDDSCVVKCYGEGYYSQRVVPSLGGGPGYGAEANPVWSIDEDVLEEILNDGVHVPSLDMGIAHGEKARGGAL